jgi:hypothetical protein
MPTATIDFTDVIAVRAERSQYSVSIDRGEAIKAIRTALKRRTGRTWSVTGGRGTAWGWITIEAPPKRRTGITIKNPDYINNGLYGDPGNPEYILVDSGEPQQFGLMTPEDIQILDQALSLGHRVNQQGITIPPGGDYYIEYIARAEGRTPSAIGRPYWD